MSGKRIHGIMVCVCMVYLQFQVCEAKAMPHVELAAWQKDRWREHAHPGLLQSLRQAFEILCIECMHACMYVSMGRASASWSVAKASIGNICV